MYFQLQFLKNLPNLFFTVSIKFLFVLNVQQNPTIQSELSIMLFLLTIVYSVVGIWKFNWDIKNNSDFK